MIGTDMQGEPGVHMTQFQLGLHGDPENAASVTTSPGLQAQQVRQQNMISVGFRPQSVLHAYMSSGIGSSARDRARMLPGGGLLPSPMDATSESTYQQLIPKMLTQGGLNA